MHLKWLGWSTKTTMKIDSLPFMIVLRSLWRLIITCMNSGAWNTMFRLVYCTLSMIITDNLCQHQQLEWLSIWKSAVVEIIEINGCVHAKKGHAYYLSIWAILTYIGFQQNVENYSGNHPVMFTVFCSWSTK